MPADTAAAIRVPLRMRVPPLGPTLSSTVVDVHCTGYVNEMFLPADTRR
jgi:hypothetical protein